MPVQFDEYEPPPDDLGQPIRDGTNAHQILSFLLERPDSGFTPREIAEATAVPRGSVGPTLQRLVARGLVRHKEPYWAAADDEQLASRSAMLASLAFLEADDDNGWADVDPSAYTVSDEELAAWRDRR